MTIVLITAKVVLVAGTLLVLSSLGGAAAPAALFLLPLHWFAARSSSHTWERWLYALLAAGIAFEAMWIAMYSMTDGTFSLLTWIPIFAAMLVTIVFIAKARPQTEQVSGTPQAPALNR